MSTRAGKTLIHQLPTVALGGHYRFIASQGDTAPKQLDDAPAAELCFITSQGDTAPKLKCRVTYTPVVSLPVRVTLLQNKALLCVRW